MKLLAVSKIASISILENQAFDTRNDLILL
jgi:hypothetical protein